MGQVGNLGATMWALIKDGAVIDIKDNPAAIKLDGINKKDLKNYRWVDITNQTGDAEIGYAYFNGKFIHEVSSPGGETSNPDFMVKDYSYVERTDVKITTSYDTGYTTLVTNDLPAGEYRVSWSYTWNYDRGSEDFLGYISHFDGSSYTEIFNHRQEPKDTGGSFRGTKSNQEHAVSGFKVLNLSGINEFEIRFGSSRWGTQAAILSGKIDIIRVK